MTGRARGLSRRPVAAAAALAVAVVFSPAATFPAAASHATGHNPPLGPAKIRFAADFPALTDSEWGFRIGGFGGVARGAPLAQVPVIFVHGNNTDHADWYPVRDAFKAAGWSDQELWALSYNGLGNNNGTALFTPNPERDAEHREMGHDGGTRVTSNDVNVPDLFAFIQAVREYTGSAKFSLVGHSLGVTVARKTLKLHPELAGDLVAFVGIAGANHGTSLCAPGTEGVVNSCSEIAAGTAWLADLNSPAETYGATRWLTVYDGSGVGDPAFAGPTYAKSPRLEGADNREFPGTYHNDLRLSPAIVAQYRVFLEEASAAARVGGPASDPGPSPASGGGSPSATFARSGTDPALPATGAAVPAGAGALAVVAALVAALARRRAQT